MANISYTVRNMVKEDVPKALDISREAEMDHCINSFYMWLEVDPEAIKVAVTDEGKVIGVCAATINDEDLAIIGLYGVQKQYRGLGIGLKLFSACMEHVAQKNACVCSVPEKIQLYQRRPGFPILESKWKILKYKTQSPVNVDKLSDSPLKEICVEPFIESHLRLIYDYDNRLLGYDRKLVIELSCKQPESRTHVAVKGDECVGFGTIKVSCQNIAIVGPLYADDKEVAEVILKKLILSLPKVKGLVMMTMSNHDAANELLKRIGCPVSRTILRLYRYAHFDNIDHSKIYGLLDISFTSY